MPSLLSRPEHGRLVLPGWVNVSLWRKCPWFPADAAEPEKTGGWAASPVTAASAENRAAQAGHGTPKSTDWGRSSVILQETEFPWCQKTS